MMLRIFETIFNSSVDYDFIFSHNFNFNATCDDKIPECILTLSSELITVLVKPKILYSVPLDVLRIKISRFSQN